MLGVLRVGAWSAQGWALECSGLGLGVLRVGAWSVQGWGLDCSGLGLGLLGVRAGILQGEGWDCAGMGRFEMLYESPGGNQVDGLPPALNGGAM